MRLIDADALKEHKYHSDITHENAVSVAQIDWMPTIQAIPIEELQEIRQEIEKIPTIIKGIGYFNERDVLAYQIDVLKIIDTHISAWSGKEEGCV